MFDNHCHVSQLKTQNFKGDPDQSLPDKRFIFKTKSVDNKPFLIYIEEYDEQYFFVKFHPSKYSSSPDKYKLRIGYKTLPVRVISSCLQVVVDKMKKHPDCAFGVFGQWDKVDIKRGSTSSQRYNMWLRIATSKFDSEKFKFLYIDILNVFLVIPADIYSEDYRDKTLRYFEKRFSGRLDELKVPLKGEKVVFNV